MPRIVRFSKLKTERFKLSLYRVKITLSYDFDRIAKGSFPRVFICHEFFSRAD